jgi:hypothetical protein
MTGLADFVSIDSHYARSANLERDAGEAAALEGYIVTGRALEMLHRIASALNTGSGGAWSVTGPYGSGKSSLGVLLAAAFGDRESAAHLSMLEQIAVIDHATASALRDARARFGNLPFLDGLVTAQAEPITHTLTRALRRATLQAFGTLPSARIFPEVRLLTAALDDIANTDPRRTGPSPGSLVDLAVALARRAPLLVVVDEFGKNLEAAQRRPDADLYLLQLIAEAAQTNRGAPIVLVTMQHLAFGDYAAAADNSQQREWAKIQGRFEDVVFVDAPAQTHQLIARVFSRSDSINARVQTWARDQAEAMRRVQLFDIADAELLADCYPLHPTVLAVLPELCRRYGQNERSLFGFLAGGEPTAVPSLLRDRPVSPSGSLPSITLADLYRYFATTANNVTARASRWAEITVKLRDIAGLPPDQLDVARAIAVLNLVASNGPLRASPALLRATSIASQESIDALVAASVVVNRRTTDEYRIWHGSDVDLEGALDLARQRAEALDPFTILTTAAPLEPVIAAGHSMRTDTLRTFDCQYLPPNRDIEAPTADSPYDGLVYIALNGTVDSAVTVEGRPVCIHRPTNIVDLIAAARELHAYDLALADVNIASDWVARNEVRERRADAHRALARCLRDAWNSGTTTLLSARGATELTRPGLLALSEAADVVYTATVPVRNETLNRVEISSIGAKARRLLLLAMLQSERLEDLGLIGNGPEVAMYRSVLRASGMHSRSERTGEWQIRQPSDPAFRHAWQEVVDQLRAATDRRINLADIYAALQLPPIGMKPGAIPVIVHAALIATNDEVALYEHGTFKPALTDDVSDRLVRNPGHFEVKQFANARPGARRDVVEQLAERLNIAARFRKSRVANVLAIVGALVNTVSRLPPITLNATDLDVRTIAVRQAILSATEPDRLLFADLPAAVGLNEVGARAKTWRHLDTFLTRLTSALTELDSHFTLTLVSLQEELLATAAESDRSKLAAQARVIIDEIIDQDVRSFTLALADETFEPARWMENLATNVTRTAVRHWKPENRRQYSTELAAKLAAFRRIQMLHHETRGIGAEPFVARRITVTEATGAERAILVALDDSDRSFIRSHYDQFIDALTHRYKSRAEAKKVALGFQSEDVLGRSILLSEAAPADLTQSKAVNDD